jgi:manganese/zinc/iron transport system ATP- binding protein
LLAPALRRSELEEVAGRAAASATEVPIAVRNLTVAYGGRPALRDVTWFTPTAGLLAVVGPNGAGKSTLLKAILGLVPKVAGEVLVYGAPIEARRGVIAYVPQRSSVDWDFPATALDVVTMGLYRRIGWLVPVRRRDRLAARAHLETVGLADLADRQIGALSGGQQQRVFLARALAQAARIYLLDEPFAGVDATTERIMIDVFHRLRREGALVVCVHHDLGSITGVYDHVLLLNGRVFAAGPTEQAFTPELIARTYGVSLRGEGSPADDVL